MDQTQARLSVTYRGGKTVMFQLLAVRIQLAVACLLAVSAAVLIEDLQVLSTPAPKMRLDRSEPGSEHAPERKSATTYDSASPQTRPIEGA